MMTREEALKLVAIIASAYPRFYNREDKTGIDRLAGIIAQTVNGTYQEAQTALRAYISLDTTGFPPAPGQLNQYIGEEILSESDAWGMVTKAIRNGTYGAEEEFAKMPPLVQAAIGSPSVLAEWSRTDNSTIQGTIRANFRRCFEAAIRRLKESQLLPNREGLPAYEAPQIEQKDESEPEYKDRTKDIEELKKKWGLS